MKNTHIFLILGMALIGCTPMDRMESISYRVFEYVESDFTELNKLNPFLGDFTDLLFFMDKSLIFSITALEYETVDPFGNTVTASGLVYHPINKKSRGVIDFLPTAHLEKTGGGTDEIYAIEGVLILLGYTIIMPDLLGSGKSKDIPIPFLMVENTGRVTYDMRRAAARYLWDQFEYVIPSETIIMGYSLGGSAALATQKYYETNYAHTVKVKEVYASSGTYDLPAAFEAFAQTGVSEYAAIPNVIVAFNHYYDLRLDLSQIFKDVLLDPTIRNNFLYGEYNSSAQGRILGHDLHLYMHDDFFKPLEEQNEELQKLYPYLVKNSTTEGWRPQAPIYMTHATPDTYVPVECAEAAVKKLRRAGANISFMTYPGDHLTVGYLFFLRSIFHFLL